MVVALVALMLADLMIGAADISLKDIYLSLTGRAPDIKTSRIVIDIRLMKTLTAVIAGAAISVSGLMMQTLFRNPLAGPFVLGISSGASFGAACFTLGAGLLGGLFGASGAIGNGIFGASGAIGNGISGGSGILINIGNSLGLAGSAWIGAAAVLAIIAFAGHRIKDIMVILILGIMLGSGFDALVQVMEYASDETSLKSYIIWTMSSVSNVSPTQLSILTISAGIGLIITIYSIKSLNLLLLGERQARSMGLNLHRSRNLVFLATILLAGTVTAFCGPIAFLGIAVPHIARAILHEADHRTLIPATTLTGAVLMLTCSLISNAAAVPLNAITSLLGIPVTIWIVLKYTTLRSNK